MLVHDYCDFLDVLEQINDQNYEIAYEAWCSYCTETGEPGMEEDHVAMERFIENYPGAN